MNRKKRVLCVGESHSSSTGFGGYTKQLLSRLHNTNKYEIAQLAIYGIINTPKDDDIDWKFYANAVTKEDHRYKEYNLNKQRTFGGWRFNEVLLDFKPDIVIDFRDPFMFSFEWLSPLRKYFYWIISPTIDSYPQQDDWLDIFASADAILTYSEFGRESLLKDLPEANILDCAYPGVELDVFKNLPNKQEIKKQLLLPLNSNIVGTVMRNQIRKLYPDLLKSFNIFLETESVSVSKNTYLYFHTSYPDMGWDMDALLNRTGLGHKVFFTYKCLKCNFIFASLWQGTKTFCPKCKNNSCILPNAENGISSTELCRVFNVFDFYVQYANCEGAGMPAVEAASCGIPIAEIDYSAMSDIVRLLNGIPMKPKGMFHSLNMCADRAYPDNKLMASIIADLVKTPTSLRRINGAKARKGAEDHFSWDDNAKKWENAIDKAVLTEKQGKWDSPISIPMISNTELPDKPFRHQVYWFIDKILGRPDLKYTLFATKLINSLEQGMNTEHGNFALYDRNRLQTMVNEHHNQRTIYEKIRCGLINPVETDYIKYAKMKADFSCKT